MQQTSWKRFISWIQLLIMNKKETPTPELRPINIDELKQKYETEMNNILNNSVVLETQTQILNEEIPNEIISDSIRQISYDPNTNTIETDVVVDTMETEDDIEYLYDYLRYQHPYGDVPEEVQAYPIEELVELIEVPTTNLYPTMQYMLYIHSIVDNIINNIKEKYQYYKVLDIGGGTGHLLNTLTKYTPNTLFEYKSIDNNIHMERIANYLHKDLDIPRTFHTSNLEHYHTIVVENERYNLITFLHTFQYNIYNIANNYDIASLHNVHNLKSMLDYFISAIENYYKLLDNEGQIVITVPSNSNNSIPVDLLDRMFVFDISYLTRIKIVTPGSKISYTENINNLNFDVIIIQKY